MLNAIADVFPKRPVRLTAPTGSFAGMAVLFIVCMGGGIAAILMPLFTLLPDLRRDWTIARDAEPFNPSEQFAAPFRSGSPIQGKCEMYGYVLKDCEIRVSYRDSQGNARTKKIALLFVDFSSGKYTITAVRSAANPDLISVDLAIERLWSRSLTMAGIMLFGVFMIAVGPLVALKNRSARLAMRNLSKHELTPITVEILSHNTVHGMNNITFSAKKGSAAKKFTTSLGKQSPFMLHMSGNEALGFTAPGQEYVFLVDEALTRLDISDIERQAIWRMRDAGNTGPSNIS